MRFRGLTCDGTDERTRYFDGGDADAPRSDASFGSANADAERTNAELHIALPPFQ